MADQQKESSTGYAQLAGFGMFGKLMSEINKDGDRIEDSIKELTERTDYYNRELIRALTGKAPELPSHLQKHESTVRRRHGQSDWVKEDDPGWKQFAKGMLFPVDKIMRAFGRGPYNKNREARVAKVEPKPSEVTSIPEAESVDQSVPPQPITKVETISRPGVVSTGSSRDTGATDKKSTSEILSAELAAQTSILQEMLAAIKGNVSSVSPTRPTSTTNTAQRFDPKTPRLFQAVGGSPVGSSVAERFAPETTNRVTPVRGILSGGGNGFEEFGKTLESIESTVLRIETILKEEQNKRVLGEGDTATVEPTTGDSSGGSSGFLSKILETMGIAGIGGKILSIFKSSKLASMLAGLAVLLKTGITKILGSIKGALLPAAKGAAGGAVRGATKGAAGLLGAVGKGLARVAPIAGVAASAIGTVTDVSEINEQVEAGEIDEATADQLKRESIGGGIGGAVGSVAGGVLGAVLGPVGAVAGSVAGGYFGNKAGEFIGKVTSGNVKAADQTKFSEQKFKLENPEAFAEYQTRKKELIQEYTKNTTSDSVRMTMIRKATEDAQKEFSGIYNSSVSSGSKVSGKLPVVTPDWTPEVTVPLRETPATMQNVMNESRDIQLKSETGGAMTNLVNNQVVNNNVNNSSIVPIKAEPRTNSLFMKHLDRVAVY